LKLNRDFILASLLSYFFIAFIAYKLLLTMLSTNAAQPSYSMGILLILGLGLGLLYVVVGIFLYKKSDKWRSSMLYLVGSSLTRGSIGMLFLLSLLASLLEEIYTRFFILALSVDHNPIEIVFYIILVNLFWTLIHLIVPKISIRLLPQIFYKAKEHLLLIFISGLPWFVVTLLCKSIIPALISHFLLDFLMGLYVRRHKDLPA